MKWINEGDCHGIAFQLQGLDNRDLYSFSRHRLAGTPYTLGGALMVVGDLALRNCWTGYRAIDENAMESIVEGDVIAYLSEDVDGDEEGADIDEEALSTMCCNAENAIVELYGLLATDIIDVVERSVKTNDGLMICDFKTEGRSTLLLLIEGM